MRKARGARAVGGEDIPDDLAVDGARDAVLELEVHLGDGVLLEDGGVRDVTCEEMVSLLQIRGLSSCEARATGRGLCSSDATENW